MKNTLKLLIAIAIAIPLTTHNANARTAFLSSSINNEIFAHTSSVSERALKDFQKTFGNVNDVTWYEPKEGGYIARFIQNDVKTIVAYNPKGNWSYTIHYYGEKKLPGDVRAMVKRTYYDYSIVGITEVQFNEQTVYMIYLQDENHFKTIRIYDDEMDEVANYPRG